MIRKEYFTEQKFSSKRALRNSVTELLQSWGYTVVKRPEQAGGILRKWHGIKERSPWIGEQVEQAEQVGEWRLMIISYCIESGAAAEDYVYYVEVK